jgi:cytidyltransferase-like protein
MIRVYTCMVADLFHPGHVAFLRAARQLGDHLTVFVLPDDMVEAHKGKRPVMTQAERVEVVAACRHVDAVMTEAGLETTLDFMQRNGFDCYTFASASAEERQNKYANSHSLPPAMIHEMPYTHGISTSEIVERIVRRVTPGG